MVESPLDGRYLLDTDGDDGDFAESGRVDYKYSTGFPHLEIRYAALLITIPTLLLIPDYLPSSGMDTLDRFAFEHRTVTRHMKTMVVKDIEDDMGSLASCKGLAIRAVTEQVEPIDYRSGFYQSFFSNNSVAGTRERMNE